MQWSLRDRYPEFVVPHPAGSVYRITKRLPCELWVVLFSILVTMSSLPTAASGQQARSTANQGIGAHYGWQDPADGLADGMNSLSLNAVDDKTLAAASRLYNTVGDPTPGFNLPAYDGNY